MKQFKWEILYNNKQVGKQFYTKAECKKEWRRLWDLELYGYVINKIKK